MNIKRSLPRNPSKADTFRRWPFSLPRDRHRIDRASYTVHSQPRGEFGSFNCFLLFICLPLSQFFLVLLLPYIGILYRLFCQNPLEWDWRWHQHSSLRVCICTPLQLLDAYFFLFILIDRSTWDILHWSQPLKTRHEHKDKEKCRGTPSSHRNWSTWKYGQLSYSCVFPFLSFFLPSLSCLFLFCQSNMELRHNSPPSLSLA